MCWIYHVKIWTCVGMFLPLFLHSSALDFLTVNVPPRMVGNGGELVTLPCSFHTLSHFTSYRLRWYTVSKKDSEKRAVYEYREDYVDEAKVPIYVPVVEMQRYWRNNVSLGITNFKEMDADDKCCEITTYYPFHKVIQCIQVAFTAFPQYALRCFQDTGRELQNGSVTNVHTSKPPYVKARCSYWQVYPRCRLEVHYTGIGGPGSPHVVATASEKHANEVGPNRYSLSVDIDVQVSFPTAFIVKATGKNLTQTLIFTMQYPPVAEKHTARLAEAFFQTEKKKTFRDPSGSSDPQVDARVARQLAENTRLAYLGGGMGGAVVFIVNGIMFALIIRRRKRRRGRKRNRGTEMETDARRETAANLVDPDTIATTYTMRPEY